MDFNSNYLVIDFETATPKRNSACQVAVATVVDNQIKDVISTYIKPPGNDYNWRNIRVHNINPNMTASSPTFDVAFRNIILQEIDFLQSFDTTRPVQIVAHNTAFDRSVFNACLEHYMMHEFLKFGLKDNWFCTHQAFRKLGYEKTKLNILCEKFGISLRHHDAASDTEATANLYIKYQEIIQNK